jgi:hypothetical protein
MSEIRRNGSANSDESAGSTARTKRPYNKPAFQHERVFETMALACGKLSPTQAQCRFNRRNS